MRILKFVAAFLVTAILIVGFVVGWNWKAFNIFFENRKALMEGSEWVTKANSLKGLSEYMGENPAHASVASNVISAADSVIYYREETPRVMGTTSNLFLLIAYAHHIEEGRINPNQMIPLDQITRYQLPDVEESVHEELLARADENGWVEEGSISYDRAIRMLPRFGDLALSDYLWWQIEPSYWQTLRDTLGLKRTQMPLPFSGLYQAISPGLRGARVDPIIARWQQADEQSWRDHVSDLSRRFAEEREFRRDALNYMEDERLGNTFMEERNAMILFPKTTALESTDVLKAIWEDSLINADVSRKVKEWMRWPMETQRGIEQDFNDYGALYDNRLGLMNGIDFGESAYTGDVTVQALYLDRLPIAFWFHASGGHMHQDFLQRLIYDPAMIDQMNRVIQN